jgi:hypothetical protein
LEILIIIGNTSLSSPHVLSVAEMFCHLCHNPNLGKREKRASWHSYGEHLLQVLPYATHNPQLSLQVHRLNTLTKRFVNWNLPIVDAQGVHSLNAQRTVSKNERGQSGFQVDFCT